MSQLTDEELMRKVQGGYMVEGPEDMTEGYRKACRLMEMAERLDKLRDVDATVARLEKVLDAAL